MKMYIKKLIYFLRNFLKIKPLIYNYPINKYASVSDSFFYRNDFIKTVFFLSNIASHTNPQIKQKDFVKIYIFSNTGEFLKVLNFTLKPFETKKIIFSDLNLKSNYGSFYVFHNFNENELLVKNKSFVTERGYLGFSDNSIFWNFVHGNHNSAYLSKKNKIKSLMTMSFFINEYFPQLTFNDCDKFDLVFTNSENMNVKYRIKTYDSENKIIDDKKFKLNSFNTTKASFENNDKKIKFVKIFSKMYFPRPVIFKYYSKYFDVLHG